MIDDEIPDLEWPDPEEPRVEDVAAMEWAVLEPLDDGVASGW